MPSRKFFIGFSLLFFGTIGIAAWHQTAGTSATHQHSKLAKSNGLCIELEVDQQQAQRDLLYEAREKTKRVLRREKIALKYLSVTEQGLRVDLISNVSSGVLNGIFPKLSLLVPNRNEPDVIIEKKVNSFLLVPSEAALRNKIEGYRAGLEQRLKATLEQFDLQGYQIELKGRAGVVAKIPRLENLNDLTKNFFIHFDNVFVVSLVQSGPLQSGEELTPPPGMKFYSGPADTSERYLGRSHSLFSGQDFFDAESVMPENGKSGIRLHLPVMEAKKYRYQNRLGIAGNYGLIIGNRIIALTSDNRDNPRGTIDFELLSKWPEPTKVVEQVKSGFHPGKVNMISEEICTW